MDALDRLIELHGPARICEAVAPMVSPERAARIEAVLDARLVSLTPVIEDLYDPHNGAAAIRSTEALGLQEFHAIEPNERFAMNTGVTRGCHRWIDLHRWSDAATCLAARRRAHLGAPGDLHTAKRAHLRARWHALKIRGVLGIIDRHVSSVTRRDVAP